MSVKTRLGLGGPEAAYPGFTAKATPPGPPSAGATGSCYIISHGIGSPSGIGYWLRGGLAGGPPTISSPYIITHGIGTPSGIPYWLTGGLGNFGTSAVVMEGVVYADYTLELGLNPLDLDDFTVVGDIRGESPLIIEYGISGGSPSDLVANTGRLTCDLDNSENNATSTVGLYSIMNGMRLSGFDLNIPVRFSLSSNAVSSGLAYPKFLGRLDEAIPDPGIYGQRAVHLTALDLMEDWATTPEPDIEPQLDKRADELIVQLLSSIDPSIQPDIIDIETGQEVYPFAFDGGTGQALTIRERLIQITQSEFGRAFLKGNGALVFHNRHHGPLNPSVLFVLDNDMAIDGGIQIDISRRSVFSRVQVSLHPTNNVTTEPIAALYSLQSAQIYVSAGETNTSLFGPYRDQDTSNQIGGTNIQALVASTDYVMNSSQDGSGTDLTANFTVTASATGAGVRWTIHNGGGIGAWIQVLQIRGVPIKRSTLTIDATVPGGKYGKQTLTVDMPYQNNANVGRDVVAYLSSILKVGQLKSVRFLANMSQAHMEAALKREPGDRIAVSETVTGVSSVEAVINGVRLECYQGGIVWCTWQLDPTSAVKFWVAGVSGSSEAGISTVAGV